MREDDEGCLDRWRAGDEGAGRDLFRRHHDELRAFLQKKADHDAEEITQEAIRISLEAVRNDRFRGESTFKTFLFGIAKNLLLEHWRKRVRDNQPLELDEEAIASLSTSIGSRLARRQQHELLRKALGMLPPDEQRLLHLRYDKELEHDELASIFDDVAPATLRSRLSRARAALRQTYDALVSDPSHTSGRR